MDAKAQLHDLREKVLNGEETSPEDYSTVLESLRKARTADNATKSKKKTPEAISNEALSDLFK